MKPSNNLEKYLDQFVNLIKEYIAQNNYHSSVINYLDTSKLRNVFDLSLPQNGDIDRTFDLIKKYLKYSPRTSHPQFFNQLWSGFDLAGFMGDILLSATNTSIYTYEVAPVATMIEKAIIEKLLSILSFSSNGRGTFVTGGSNGNLIGMLLARNRMMKRGYKIEDLCAFYSEECHYSLDTAAMILGIRKENIIKIPCDQDRKMNSAALQKTMFKISTEGKVPFFLCAIAGTTVAGVFDNIEEMANICRKYDNCWLHVDGAHGASIILSKKYKKLLTGIDLADSIVWDWHKLMGVPLICSVFLTQHGDELNFHSQSKEATSYLFHSNKDNSDDVNLGIYSLQCGRRAECIKLWLMWHFHGSQGLEKIVDHLMSLAIYAEKKVAESSHLTLATKREYVNVCFFLKNTTSLDHDQLHYHVKNILYHSGLTMVNTARIDEKVCIRLVITNSNIKENDIDIFFDNVERALKTVADH